MQLGRLAGHEMFHRLSSSDLVTSLIDFAASRLWLLVAASRARMGSAVAAWPLSTRARLIGGMTRCLLPMWLALATLILATPTLPCAAQERGYLGVELQDLSIERTHQLRQALGRDAVRGVLVVSPRRGGSPAEQAGLLADDIILALDDLPMESMAAAVDYIGSRAPGTRLKIQIWRDGERRDLLATLGRFPETLALVSQIQALTNQRRYTEAIPLAERLVQLTQANSAPLSADYAAALDRLGDALYADGRYPEAEPLNRRALAIREQALGARHPDVGWAHNRLGNTLDMLGRYDEAIAHYRSMISIMEVARGLEHDDVGLGLGNVGNTLQKAGRYTEATATLRRALAIREKALGPESPTLVNTLRQFCDALYADGKYSEAEPLNRRLLAIREQTLGAMHPDVGWAHIKLGNALDGLGRYDEAIAHYRSMISIMEVIEGPEHDDVGLGLGNLGNTLRKAGRHAEAAATLRRALALREKALGPDNPKLVWILEKLGDELFAIGQSDEARLFSQRALAIWDKTQAQPPTEPFPRIETGMHGAPIKRISVDNACEMMVTGSEDKTARLWELPKDNAREPKLMRVLRVPIGSGFYGRVQAVALSPNGQLVAAGGWNRNNDHRVYVFDSATGRLVRRLSKLASPIEHLVFSRDGKFLAATLHDGEGVRIWKTGNWTLVAQDQDYSEESYGAAFDAAGRLYTVAYDGFLRRYGVDFELEAKVKTSGGANPYTVAVHPKGEMVAVGFANSPAVEVYDAQQLKLLFVAATGGARDFYAVTWSADGERLYAGGRYTIDGATAVRIWEREGRGEARDVPIAHNTIMGVQPCADSIAVGAQDPAFGLISLTGEKRLWQEGHNPDMSEKVGDNFKVSDDGSRVRFGLGQGGESPVLFDLMTGRLMDQHVQTSGLAKPDAESLKLSDWKNNRPPKLDGKPLETEQFETSRSVAIAPGGDRFVLGTEWYLRAYDKDGKALWKKPVSGIARGVNIARNGKLVVAAYGDGTVRWHRLADGEEIVALFVQPDSREWALWTPQGYYASSVAGDQLIGWQLNKGWEQAGEFVAAARLKQHLYRPDIVKRAFELADAEAAVREADLQDFKLADLAIRTPPQFRVIDPHDKAHANRSPVAVRIAVAIVDDPITGFDVKVNGRQVTPRTVRDLPRGAKETEPPTLNVPLEKGENRIQITARNDVGETVNELMVYLDREGLLDRKGRLFVLAVGVDDYSRLGQGSALHYAGADARLIVDTLIQKAAPLHTEVKSKLLVSGGDMPPTKVNIEDALVLFREAQPEDTVILFLAGHGVNDGADYLFMPEDAQRMGNDHWRPSSVVSWHVLQHALQEAHGNRIMFVDTCHARGAFSPRLVKDAFDANIVVFSATDQDSLAQERADLGHGVFSYALSEGLKGAANFTKRGGVSLFQLGEFVSEEVKRLTNDEQEPTFSLSQVKNFMLAAP
jgi:tetratricopeptide (TPR) repeat protein/WD40 repeat protein